MLRIPTYYSLQENKVIVVKIVPCVCIVLPVYVFSGLLACVLITYGIKIYICMTNLWMQNHMQCIKSGKRSNRTSGEVGGLCQHFLHYRKCSNFYKTGICKLFQH